MYSDGNVAEVKSSDWDNILVAQSQENPTTPTFE